MKDEWTTENQLLTSTMKVRRGKIDKLYAEKHKKWHEQKDNIIWQ